MVVDLTNNPSDSDVDTRNHELVMTQSQKVYTSKVGDYDRK